MKKLKVVKVTKVMSDDHIEKVGKAISDANPADPSAKIVYENAALALDVKRKEQEIEDSHNKKKERLETVKTCAPIAVAGLGFLGIVVGKVMDEMSKAKDRQHSKELVIAMTEYDQKDIIPTSLISKKVYQSIPLNTK